NSSSVPEFPSNLNACHFAPSDTPKHRDSRQAVQSKAAGRFTSSIQTGDHLTARVDHLALGVDFQTGQRVMKYLRRPRRVERRLLNFEHRCRLSELHILTHVDV